MKRVVSTVLLLIALIGLTFHVTVRVAHAPPGGSVLTVGVAGMFPTLALAVGSAAPNDEIHVLPGHIEVLGFPLIIAVNNLWIVGAPISMGPMPWIDLAGGWIDIVSNNVYITGLNIVDTTGTSPGGIRLFTGTSGCRITRNTITGMASPGSIGIEVTNSAGNVIALNTITTWDIGIDLIGPGTTMNLIKLNFIDISMMTPTAAGVRVGFGAVMNHVFWNNIMGLPSPPFLGLGQELWDLSPGNPPNIFDDSGQALTYGRGNLETSWTIPPPYLVAGPGMNGWFDVTPLMVPMSQLTGDINLDGTVDLFDAILLASNFGQIWCQLGWEPAIDFNTDGAVDLFDAILLAGNFGATY